MNKKNFIIYILLVILIYFILYIIYNNFKKENFICINPKKINNNGFCKGLYPIRFMGSNPSKEELEKKCNDNKYCKGYIIVEYIYGGRTNYFALKCQDNWDGEIQYDDSFKDKIKEFLVEYYDYSSVEHLESEVNIINFENYKCNTVCPKGKGINSNNICINCPDNQYNAGDNYTCSPINYFDGFKFNTYDTNTGITNNTICPEGTYAIKGSKECTTCPDGEYQDQKGKTQCIKYRSSCPSGQFLKENNGNKTTDKTCEDCPTGHYSSDGITCTQVRAGYEINSNNNGEQKCPAGKFSTAGSSSCTNCPAGEFSSTSGSSSCSPCPAGQFPNEDSTSCSPCPAGQFSTAGSSSCSPCPAGEFSSTLGSSACTNCPAGKFSSAGSRYCSPCPAGEFSSAGSPSCTNCPGGTFSSSSGSTTCNSCPAGKFSSAGSTSCSKCPAGSVSSEGWHACQPCTSGTYQTRLGKSACNNCRTCGDNEYESHPCTKTQNTVCSPCGGCPVGKYRSGCSGQSGGSCTNCGTCPAGKERLGCSGRSAGSCSFCVKIERGKNAIHFDDRSTCTNNCKVEFRDNRLSQDNWLVTGKEQGSNASVVIRRVDGVVSFDKDYNGTDPGFEANNNIFFWQHGNISGNWKWNLFLNPLNYQDSSSTNNPKCNKRCPKDKEKKKILFTTIEFPYQQYSNGSGCITGKSANNYHMFHGI